MALIGCKAKALVTAWAAGCLLVAPALATELKPETVATFDHYIQATEARMAEDLAEDRFLIIDGLPDGRRQQVYAQVRQGLIYIEELTLKKTVDRSGFLVV